MKSHTDLEQSKKLAEILPKDGADMAYFYDENNGNLLFPTPFILLDIEGYFSRIPCWSLVALEGLMPFHIIENNNRFGFYQIKGFNKQGETYRFGYKTNNDSFLFETSWYNDVIDAAFEMICWLKKEEYI